MSLENFVCPMCGTVSPELLASRVHSGKQYSLALCQKCGQHFCVPPPSASEIAAFYEGDYHTELRTPGASEKLFGEKFRRYRDWVTDFLKTGRTLDIGTATGLFPRLLKQAGFEAEGLEFNPQSAEWAQAHYGIRIRTCALEALSDMRGSYDLISMTDVLEHTECPLEYLQMARQYLRPGGFMLITFPDIRSVESRYLHFLARTLRRDWLWSTCHIPLHVWEFTEASARAMFLKAGFEVAGFQRSHHVDEDTKADASVRILRAPLKLLGFGPLGRMAGTQMEFMIRRVK